MLKHIYDNEKKEWLRVQSLAAYYYIKNEPNRYSEEPFKEKKKELKKETPKKITRKKKSEE